MTSRGACRRSRPHSARAWRQQGLTSAKAAADIQDQTDFFTDRDVATLRFNGRKDAWSAAAIWRSGAVARQRRRQPVELSSYATVLSAASRVKRQVSITRRRGANMPRVLPTTTRSRDRAADPQTSAPDVSSGYRAIGAGLGRDGEGARPYRAARRRGKTNDVDTR